MTTTTLSSKGQLVVPREIRQKLGLQAGDVLVCEIKDESLTLSSVKKQEARVQKGNDGLIVLSAPEGAPEMTPEYVKSLLHD